MLRGPYVGLSFCPAPGEEVVDTVHGMTGGEAGQDVGEIGLGIYGIEPIEIDVVALLLETPSPAHYEVHQSRK